jgi:hypothetical protein
MGQDHGYWPLSARGLLDGLVAEILRLTDAGRSLIGPHDVSVRRSPGGFRVQLGATRCGQTSGHAAAARRPASSFRTDRGARVLDAPGPDERRPPGALDLQLGDRVLPVGFVSPRVVCGGALSLRRRRMVSNMILNLSAAGARDSLIEIVGIKAGLVIASGDLVDVLDRELAKSNEDSWYYSPCEWLHAPPGQWVRVRAEEFESLII